jgi:hypothetical protein
MRRPIVLLALAASLAAQDPEPAKDRPVLRVYELGALAPMLKRPLHGEGASPAERDFSILGSTHAWEAERESDWIEEEQPNLGGMVAELLKSFGHEPSVMPVDGGRALLVRAGEADHRTFARVVEQLRGAGDPPVELDVRHLTLFDRTLDDSARAALAAPGRIDAEQLALLARQQDARGGRRGGTLHAPLGRWAVYRAVRQVRYLPDFDVEIAQAAAVADPVPSIATDGLKVAVRPFLLRDGRLLLRVIASAGDLDGEVRHVSLAASEVQDELRLRNTDFGEVEQCDYRGGVVSTDLVAAPGRTATVVLATEAQGETRYDILALTVRASPRPAGVETFVVTPVGALVAGDFARGLSWHAQTGELTLLPREDEPPARFQIDGLIESLGVPMEEEGEFRNAVGDLHGGSIIVRASMEKTRAFLDGIGAMERDLIRPVRLEIRFTVERPGRETRAVGLLASPITAGRGVALAAYRRVDTIGDYDVEVAQESRIADPNHVVVTAGIFANAAVFANADGTYRLHLDLTVRGAPEPIRPIVSHVGGVPTLQSVAISRRTDPLRLDVAPGKPRTIDLGPDPFVAGGDGRLVAVVTVEPQ